MVQIDMPMPKSCYDCQFSVDNKDYHQCSLLQQKRVVTFDRRKRRLPECPLNPVGEEENEMKRCKEMLKIFFNRCKDTGSANGELCEFCGMEKECKEIEE